MLLHNFIKEVLFSPWVVAVSLIVGGFLILLIERIRPRPRVHDVETMSLGTALAIGCCQILAMIPGVSRAGATIMGALMLRVDRPAATEFSFFLAIPTMLGATVYDLYKNRAILSFDGARDHRDRLCRRVCRGAVRGAPARRFRQPDTALACSPGTASWSARSR